MKWIKLFENFDNDALEDAKHIIISHLGEIEEEDFAGGEFPIAMPDRLKDRIRVYRLLESPNVRDLSGCEEHLEQETEGVFWNVNLDWYSGKIAVIGLGDSIESFLVEWLKERFCEAHSIEKRTAPQYSTIMKATRTKSPMSPTIKSGDSSKARWD